MKEAIEEIILRHPGRGMDILAHHMRPDFCEKAVRELLKRPRGTVLLTTGFYVGGWPETDGPVGTYFLAKVLKEQGFDPVIVTDAYCRDLFREIPVRLVDFDAEKKDFIEILDEYEPVCCISIERCGRNAENDYANMRGISIKPNTAPVDMLFELAWARDILTIGIGDGGNEIGMGNVCGIIFKELSLVPCTTRTDYLIISTISNWGAYGMIAYICALTGADSFPTYESVRAYLQTIVDAGCVDGVSKKHTATVDGFPVEREEEIVTTLYNKVHS